MGQDGRGHANVTVTVQGFLRGPDVVQWSAPWLAFFLGVVIPTLVALVVELYLVLPIRYAHNPEVELRVRVVDMWALGLLYSKIALRAHRLQGGGFLTRGIEQVKFDLNFSSFDFDLLIDLFSFFS